MSNFGIALQKVAKIIEKPAEAIPGEAQYYRYTFNEMAKQARNMGITAMDADIEKDANTLMRAVDALDGKAMSEAERMGLVHDLVEFSAFMLEDEEEQPVTVH